MVISFFFLCSSLSVGKNQKKRLSFSSFLSLMGRSPEYDSPISKLTSGSPVPLTANSVACMLTSMTNFWSRENHMSPSMGTGDQVQEARHTHSRSCCSGSDGDPNQGWSGYILTEECEPRHSRRCLPRHLHATAVGAGGGSRKCALLRWQPGVPTGTAPIGSSS